MWRLMPLIDVAWHIRLPDLRPYEGIVVPISVLLRSVHRLLLHSVHRLLLHLVRDRCPLQIVLIRGQCLSHLDRILRGMLAAVFVSLFFVAVSCEQTKTAQFLSSATTQQPINIQC